ncbi:hypothetical protein D4R87_03160, partial [bacterium]
IINSLISFAREKTNLAINIYLFLLVTVLLLIGVVSLGSGTIKTVQVDLTVPDNVEINEELLHNTISQIEIREENFLKVLDIEYRDIFHIEEETVENSEDIEAVES